MTPHQAAAPWRAVVRYAVPAIAVLVALLQPVGPALAAAPTPPPKVVPEAIEPFAVYQGASICAPVARNGPKQLRALLTATYGTTAYGITRSCTGSSATSEHNEGRALDWMISGKAQKADAKAFLAWLFNTDADGNEYAMARRMGIMYIVWNNRMFRMYDTSRGWSAYSNCASHPEASYDTTCHRNHVHFSFTWDGAAGATSYWSGQAVTAPNCPPGAAVASAPALSAQGLEFVPLPATRILNTAKGVGVAARCRLSQDEYSGQNRRIDLQVAGVGGVPPSGAVAAVLSLQTLSPNAPTQLFVKPTGGSKLLRATSTAMEVNGLGAVTVPLGTGGRVSLTLSKGAADVTADLLGYYRVADGTGALFHPVAPSRVLNTLKQGVMLQPGESRVVQVGGRAGVPTSGATAVALTATVYDGTTSGGVAVYSPDDPAPPSGLRSVSAAKDGRRTNLVVARIGADGTVLVRNTASGARHVLLDVAGWWAPTSVPDGSLYALLNPKQTIDTSDDQGLTDPLRRGVTATVALTGRAGVPTSGVTAVALQATLLRPSSRTTLVAWPGDGSARPLARTATADGGVDTTAFAVAPLSAGRVALQSTSGRIGLRAYAVGYWFQ